jgi:hypothetical protein
MEILGPKSLEMIVGKGTTLPVAAPSAYNGDDSHG